MLFYLNGLLGVGGVHLQVCLHATRSNLLFCLHATHLECARLELPLCSKLFDANAQVQPIAQLISGRFWLHHQRRCNLGLLLPRLPLTDRPVHLCFWGAFSLSVQHTAPHRQRQVQSSMPHPTHQRRDRITSRRTIHRLSSRRHATILRKQMDLGNFYMQDGTEVNFTTHTPDITIKRAEVET